jgi:hypothetical protein
MSKAAELANLIGNINAGGGGANKNAIINGSMNVAQRSVSATGLGGSDPSYQTLDRFRMNIGGTSAGRFTMAQDSSAPEGFANSLKLSCTTADTSIGADELLSLQQRIEGQNLQMFAKGTPSAKPFAVSFYVKGNASATYTCELEDGDNSRRVAKEFSVTTDWARVELSFPKDTTGAFDDDNALSLSLNIFLHGGSNFTSGTFSSNTWESISNTTRLSDSQTSFFDSTDRTFFLTGCQLEVGQNPTTFEHEPFERTLYKCERYLSTFLGEANYEGVTPGGIASSSTRAWYVISHRTTMRATPSLTHNKLRVDQSGVAGQDATGATLDTGSTKSSVIYVDVSSGLTANNSYHLVSTSSGSSGGYLRLDAEL